MAFHYYYGAGGAAVGDAGRYATRQTGTLATLGAANYYATEAAARAATTPPGLGDFLYTTDDNSYAGAFFGSQSAPYTYVAVSALDIGQYRRDGFYPTITGVDIAMNNYCKVQGFSLQPTDDVDCFESANMTDCEIIITGSGGALEIAADRRSAILTGCTLNLNHTGANIEIAGGGHIEFIGGVITGTVIPDHVIGGGGNGGCSAVISGADMSGLGATTLVGTTTTASGDVQNISFFRCKVASGVTKVLNIPETNGMMYTFTEVGLGDSDMEYSFSAYKFSGVVTDDTAIFRNEDEPFESTAVKISYEIVTTAEAGVVSSFQFNFPLADWVDFGTATNLRMYVTSNSVLTDADIYLQVIYPDATTGVPVSATSAPTLSYITTLNPMATPTTLTTDGVSTWTGGLTNKYFIDVPITVVGQPCYPIIKVFTTKPSTTINLATETTIT